MPTYVYRFVDTGETVEVTQSFTDETLTQAVHPSTGELRPVKKVITPVGVTFKGNGFYKTDSRSSTKRSSTLTTADSSSSESSTSGSSSESSESSTSTSESSTSKDKASASASSDSPVKSTSSSSGDN